MPEEYGRGFSRSNVAGMRQFYMAYKDREDEIIQSGIGQLETAYKNTYRKTRRKYVLAKSSKVRALLFILVLNCNPRFHTHYLG